MMGLLLKCEDCASAYPQPCSRTAKAASGHRRINSAFSCKCDGFRSMAGYKRCFAVLAKLQKKETLPKLQLDFHAEHRSAFPYMATFVIDLANYQRPF